jgi:serine protease Do
MSTLKRLLMAATVLTALAGSAQADTVNNFRLEYYPDLFKGACIADSYYKHNKVTLNIAVSYQGDNNTKVWGIMLENKEWKTKDKTYEVTVRAGPENNPANRKTLVRTFTGLKEGGIVVNDLTPDEINTLAFDGPASVWFYFKNETKPFAAFQINNSGNSIRATQACLKAHAPNNDVAKAPPTTKPPTPPKEGGNTGTGFFVAPKQVLTSGHVVKNCNAIYVKYPSYKAVPAYLVSYDEKNDLAVLKTELPFDTLASFRLRGKLGEFVASYGFPYSNVLASSGNFTTGGLTALRGTDDDTSTIQVSAALQPGNSGGPLMDSSGAVIGISKEILTIGQNVNFGVSAGTAVTFLGANNIDAQVTSGGTKMEPEQVAELAQKFTVQLMCNN